MLKGMKGRTRKRALRIFFATDIHGSEVCFRKFLAAATVYEADAIILGGDYAGKALVPVLSVNGALVAQAGGKEVTVPEDGWEQLEGDLTKRGFYPVRMTPEQLGQLEADPAALDALFKEQIKTQLQRWCDLAAERLKPDVRCIVTPGNDDPAEADAVLVASERVECPEFELCELGPLTMISIGLVPHTPWDTERECSEEDPGCEDQRAGRPCPRRHADAAQPALSAVRVQPGRRPRARCHAQAGHSRRPS